MKVLQLTMDTTGGIIHYTSQLSNALAKNNDVYVITPTGAEYQLFDDSVKLIQLPLGNVKKNLIKNSLIFSRPINLLRTINRIDPDIIHLQFPHIWLCLFLPFLKKYRIISTLHNLKSHNGYMSIDQDLAQKLYIKYSEAIIVHGNFAKRELEKKIKNKMIFSIPVGDFSFFKKCISSEYKEQPNTILFFGAIKEYKGLSFLIKAIPIITKNIPNLKVIIAGAGDFKEKKYVEGSPYFELYNRYIPNEEVNKFFQTSSLVVLPYIEATQTGIIPIAYAFKKPVVVTDVGSIPEVVDNGVTGFIVPPKDPIALSNAIIEILTNDTLRMHMGKNAFEKMNTEMSWDIISAKTIQTYNLVLNMCIQ